MEWIRRLLRWLWPRKHTDVLVEPARTHDRSRLHRGWHRDPGRPPWHKGRKARSVTHGSD